jgi:phenylalanyl-tRNA synthetase alpha chain
MLNRVETLRKEFEADISSAKDVLQLEGLRIKYLGRKAGLVNELVKLIKDVPAEQKSSFGKEANDLKNHIENTINERKARIEEKGKSAADKHYFDVTLPGISQVQGSFHPIQLVRREIEEIFSRLGYTIAEGPEAETDWNNFEALNMPPHHPARDMQDTFYLECGLVLRTQTSPVQIRTMLAKKPPVRIICPGRTFRCDWDITHTPNFYQCEGLLVDVGVSLADLKGTIDHFCKEMFSNDIKTRLRPSYFPFVEPGAEVDIQCQICKGKGCRTCKNAGWLEIMGAGMVHVNVLENVGIDSEIYTGFAFGMGMDRIAMLKYGIDDTRLNYESNIRFIEQFRGL